MKTKFFFILTLLLVSSVSLLPVPVQSQAIGKQFTYSLEIDDSKGLLDDWGDGNGNGAIELGERVKLKITLKNKGKTSVQNVVGTLSTQNNFVHIADNKVNYGDIDPNKSDRNIFDNFRFEILASLPTQVVTFTLTLTADNDGLWRIPITLDIINPTGIGIDLPNDLLSEVAFSANSTYFILQAKYPKLTGVPEAEVSYGSCTITLHIPSGTHPFIFPIKTKEEVGIDAGVNAIVSLGLEIIPYSSTIIAVLDFFFKTLDMVNRDLTVELQNLIPDTERPETEKEYLVLLKNMSRTLRGINITVKQQYLLGSGTIRYEVERAHFWDFSKGWAAPPAQPLALSDYPPFRLLPPEVQEYLLVGFAAFKTPETWLIPDETVMGQNYPNPFNPETWIPYQLAEPSEVSVTIYNAKGAIVRRLLLGHQSAGYYTGRGRAAYWDGRNIFGERVANGLYFYQLTTDQTSFLRKMAILK